MTKSTHSRKIVDASSPAIIVDFLDKIFIHIFLLASLVEKHKKILLESLLNNLRLRHLISQFAHKNKMYNQKYKME